MIVRRATVQDCAAMADILNPLIADGTTTALAGPISVAQVLGRLETNPSASAWHVAEASGRVIGFQWISPHPNLPPEALDIASFVAMGEGGKGIGRALFNATLRTAIDLNATWLNATIRADNTGGLRYYRGLGFTPWHTDHDIRLPNGKTVSKISHRLNVPSAAAASEPSLA